MNKNADLFTRLIVSALVLYAIFCLGQLTHSLIEPLIKTAADWSRSFKNLQIGIFIQLLLMCILLLTLVWDADIEGVQVLSFVNAIAFSIIGGLSITAYLFVNFNPIIAAFVCVCIVFGLVKIFQFISDLD